MKQALREFISGKIRLPLQKASYFVNVCTGQQHPFVPPGWLHSVGQSDFIKTGEEFCEYFLRIGGLKPDDRVLDVGCGTGRMALPLVDYLKDGSYDGIDIVASSVKWCQNAYTPRYPNFKFHFADIYNKAYNPKGKYKASEYRFPFDDSSFDFIFLTSVFTHMLAQDMENYLSEIARVLKLNGRCFITYFLLNSESVSHIKEGSGNYAFEYEFQGCYVEDRDVPEAVVAYNEAMILALYKKFGLQMSKPILYGNWCGRKNGLSVQDIVVASHTE